MKKSVNSAEDIDWLFVGDKQFKADILVVLAFPAILSVATDAAKTVCGDTETRSARRLTGNTLAFCLVLSESVANHTTSTNIGAAAGETC